jgi:hypothetical protein
MLFMKTIICTTYKTEYSACSFKNQQMYRIKAKTSCPLQTENHVYTLAFLFCMNYRVILKKNNNTDGSQLM